MNAYFPFQIWDGFSGANRDRKLLSDNIDPDAVDYNRLAVEIVALQKNSSYNDNQTEDFSLNQDSAAIQLVDCSDEHVTCFLDAAATLENRQFTFKKVAGSNTVILSPNGSETIDGETSAIISELWNAITIVSDGSNWFII